MPGSARAGLLWHPHQDVGQTVFLGACRPGLLGAQELVNLGVAHGDLVIHFPFFEAGEQDLAAKFLPEFLEVDAIPLQSLAQIIHGKPVLLRDPVQRPVELGVIHPQAGIPG